jgi:hypothetical protein
LPSGAVGNPGGTDKIGDNVNCRCSIRPELAEDEE